MFSGPIPTRVNHRKLASEKRKIEGFLPPDKLDRFSEAVIDVVGDLEVSLVFRRGPNRSGLMTGSAKAIVSLECQNCMQAFEQSVTAKFRHVLVQQEAQLFDLADDQDGIVCPSEMVEVSELIEDELILALPMVARHESGQCAPEDDQLDDYQADDVEATETYKPFAGLGELTKELTKKS